MFKDYYAILEISHSATLAEIKSAYRTQALKWHPDKNRGIDTTEKMKEINEAKLILTDEEARIRYHREYLRFKSFQQEKQKQKQKEKETERSKQYEHKKQEQEKETYENNAKNTKEDYSTYHIYDQILKKWMENARKQAIRNVHEMITEFRDSSIAGFGAFFKTTLMVIVIGIIYFLIIQILKAI